MLNACFQIGLDDELFQFLSPGDCYIHLLDCPLPKWFYFLWGSQRGPYSPSSNSIQKAFGCSSSSQACAPTVHRLFTSHRQNAYATSPAFLWTRKVVSNSADLMAKLFDPSISVRDALRKFSFPQASCLEPSPEYIPAFKRTPESTPFHEPAPECQSRNC